MSHPDWQDNRCLGEEKSGRERLYMSLWSASRRFAALVEAVRDASNLIIKPGI